MRPIASANPPKVYVQLEFPNSYTFALQLVTALSEALETLFA